MASTNKTSHYELSQFLGTDVPSWLNDYNADNRAIDTGIYNAQTKADSAYTLADTADGKADNATLTANSALTNAGTANTNIGTMANLETTEKSSLVGAINEVKTESDNNASNIEKFDFTTFTTYTSSDMTTEGCTLDSDTSITIAKNSDGSICKIYGNIRMTKSAQTARIFISNTGIIPTELIHINPAGFEQAQPNSRVAVRLKTDGSVELVSFGAGSGSTITTTFIPFVIFVKNFGDVV